MGSENDTRLLLNAALHNQIATGCPGVILEVNCPRLGLMFAVARGLFARNTAKLLQVEDSFRAASVTKAVTASLAVSLAAKEYWNLDDPITRYLPSRAAEKLRMLKGLQTDKHLTIRRLLGHTSGLPDYFFDERFQNRVSQDPTRVWQPEELLDAALEGGELLFAPGTDFAYGDTGYVVAGAAIERVLDCPLAKAYRTWILEPLGMEATYLEWHEAPRGRTLSHHYDKEKDLRERNFSFDWAGGGLVTTAGDLTKFLRGLFGETLFSRRWLAELTDWQVHTRWRPHGSARYLGYGLGLGTNLAYGEELIGVTGVWGAFAYYWPAGDATITGTLNLVDGDRLALMDEIIRALKKIQPPTQLPKVPACLPG